MFTGVFPSGNANQSSSYTVTFLPLQLLLRLCCGCNSRTVWKKMTWSIPQSFQCHDPVYHSTICTSTWHRMFNSHLLKKLNRKNTGLLFFCFSSPRTSRRHAAVKSPYLLEQLDIALCYDSTCLKSHFWCAVKGMFYKWQNVQGHHCVRAIPVVWTLMIYNGSFLKANTSPKHTL